MGARRHRRHIGRWGRAAHRSLLFAPVVDGDVLPVCPWEARSGTDLLVGHTRDEHRLFSAFVEVTAEQLATAVEVLPRPRRAAGVRHPDRGAPASLIDDLEAAEAVSARMRAAWIAYATTGDPGWPAFDDDGLVQVFDTRPAVVPYPEEESRRIWRDHVFSRWTCSRRTAASPATPARTAAATRAG